MLDPDNGLDVEIKQPWEYFPLDMQLASRIRTGDEISLVDEVIIENQGKVTGSIDIALGQKSYSGTIAQVEVSGGTDGENYKITYRCTTLAGDRVEADGMIWVRD